LRSVARGCRLAPNRNLAGSLSFLNEGNGDRRSSGVLEPRARRLESGAAEVCQASIERPPKIRRLADCCASSWRINATMRASAQGRKKDHCAKLSGERVGLCLPGEEPISGHHHKDDAPDEDREQARQDHPRLAPGEIVGAPAHIGAGAQSGVGGDTEALTIYTDPCSFQIVEFTPHESIFSSNFIARFLLRRP
jgi:hypothetical protein